MSRFRFNHGHRKSSRNPESASKRRFLSFSSIQQTFYTWKKKYGGLGISELRRMKLLEEQNRKLKCVVADLSVWFEEVSGNPSIESQALNLKLEVEMAGMRSLLYCVNYQSSRSNTYHSQTFFEAPWHEFEAVPSNWLIARTGPGSSLQTAK